MSVNILRQIFKFSKPPVRLAILGRKRVSSLRLKTWDKLLVKYKNIDISNTLQHKTKKWKTETYPCLHFQAYFCNTASFKEKQKIEIILSSFSYFNCVLLFFVIGRFEFWKVSCRSRYSLTFASRFQKTLLTVTMLSFFW